LSALVARLLAPGLSGAEIMDVGQVVAIHPQEEVHVAQSAERRRRDFALGRFCARAAMAPLGHGAAAIPMGEGGAPHWPDGLLGTITHTKAYAAAVAGRTRDFSGIGVDAERVGGVSEELWPRLFAAAEREQLLAAQDRSVKATLLFSAKEACYKAWRLKAPPAFRDIHIALEERGFLATHAGRTLQGHHVVEGDLVLTAVWVLR